MFHIKWSYNSHNHSDKKLKRNIYEDSIITIIVIYRELNRNCNFIRPVLFNKLVKTKITLFVS